MKTMKYYHDLYLKCDALLSADVFDKFRNNSLKSYVLGSSHYLNAPILSCNAMLNMTKVELKLIPDSSMYILFEKVREEEFLIFLIDIVRPTTSILNLITQNKNKNILDT